MRNHREKGPKAELPKTKLALPLSDVDWNPQRRPPRKSLWLLAIVTLLAGIWAYRSLPQKSVASRAKASAHVDKRKSPKLRRKPSQPAIKAEARTSPAAKRRFHKIRREMSKKDPSIVFLGDSITRGFEFTGGLWQRVYGRRGAVNAGIGSDRYQHILHRLQHDQLAKKQPKLIVLLCGINNINMNSPKEISQGIDAIIRTIHKQSPKTKVLLLGLFPAGHDPRDPKRNKVAQVNKYLTSLSQNPQVTYADIGTSFLRRDGKLTKDISYDGIHLTGKGYQIWTRAMKPYLRQALSRG